MSPEEIAVIAGIILTLAFSYIPKLNISYGLLDPTYKRLIMAGLLLVVSAGAYGLSCAGLAADFGLLVTCDRPALIGLVRSFIVAVVANQSLYALSPEASAVEQAKEQRDGTAELALGRG